METNDHIPDNSETTVDTTEVTIDVTNTSSTVIEAETVVLSVNVTDEAPVLVEETNSTPIVDDSPVTVTPLVVDDAPILEELEAPLPEGKRKKQNVTQQFPTNMPEKLESADTLNLPSNHDEETEAMLSNVANVSLVDSVDSREWANSVARGLEFTTNAEIFVETLEDPNADFRQANEVNGINLSAGAPRFAATSNQTMEGERAVIRMITHLGLGTLFQVPLWNSGFWITFKPPGEDEIIELHRILNSDKIKLGRHTYGLSFSNVTSYTIDRLVEFALDHVYDTTVKSEELGSANLRHHMSSQDIPSFLWGFVCTMYPRGFNYVRACVDNPEKCQHIEEDTLNVSKLQWSNLKPLTEWQKTHMSSRQARSKDLASVKRYKEELGAIQKKRIVINEGTATSIALTIKTPSIFDYVEAGHRWVGDIVETVNKAIGADSRSDERNTLITRHGQASAMRQYSHWIESIEYDTNLIEDLETIEKTLNVLSSDDVIRSTFIDAVVDYINKSTLSVVGIPVYDCPKCGTTQHGSTKLPHHTNVIPLDVVQVFFGLLVQRLGRMKDR